MRFVLHETWGSLVPRTSRYPDGVTVTVHDTVNLYRVVGLFRSEDKVAVKRDAATGQWGGSRALGGAGARQAAAELAERLNDAA